MELKISANYEASPILFIMSKGKVVESRPISMTRNEKIENIEITPDMIPEARFLVLENLEKGWAADSLSYFVQADFANSVSIQVVKRLTVLLSYIYSYTKIVIIP